MGVHSRPLSKLTPVSWKFLVKRLNELGFEGPYSGGKHPFMIKGDLVLTIPNETFNLRFLLTLSFNYRIQQQQLSPCTNHRIVLV
jgi:hypothetical protein